MISEKNTKLFMDNRTEFESVMCSLESTAKQPTGIINDVKKAIELAKDFNEAVVKPNALKMDRLAQEDHDFLPIEFMKIAGEWGLYTQWLPKIFGGRGWAFPSFSHFVEEISSQCTAMANLIGVHYLGVATLMATWNTKIIDKICKDIVKGEKQGKPCLVSLALTEPDAGTDMEEDKLMDKGKVTCHAKKVKGGWRVTGRKVFISNGHLSTWHVLFAFTDTSKPSENLILMVIKTGMKGFSFGRTERKMGQKVCPASELIFDDCFVPDEYICLDPAQAEKLKRTKSQTTMQLIDYVFGASRAGVCAFGTGVARGAYEQALKFASNTKVSGKLLINHEWAQSMLAEMYKNVALSRLAYTEANYSCGLFGMYKYLQVKPVYYLWKYLPLSFCENILSPIISMPMGTQVFRKLCCDMQTDEEAKCVSGWGSLAKFSGTDAGVKNCQMALQLMGQAGIRHGLAEKHLRDAKLMQIYEGTNQLNKLNVFKCFIADSCKDTSIFDE